MNKFKHWERKITSLSKRKLNIKTSEWKETIKDQSMKYLSEAVTVVSELWLWEDGLLHKPVDVNVFKRIVHKYSQSLWQFLLHVK